jgi:hypothetical protein
MPIKRISFSKHIKAAADRPVVIITVTIVVVFKF